ncbi:hypothetical protein CYMTET_42462 [Cymbomonas tetramitiformis]|uniref:Uncharacterized protein n=1 Tax=Cymbomonas tetramitiformis TaxID=36881 RepID=A0AAE0C436_9CHLO|nr:hypothetical protein CYMTET_42462 [Cymbomonas tetramitiformis]
MYCNEQFIICIPRSLYELRQMGRCLTEFSENGGVASTRPKPRVDSGLGHGEVGEANHEADVDAAGDAADDAAGDMQVEGNLPSHAEIIAYLDILSRVPSMQEHARMLQSIKEKVLSHGTSTEEVEGVSTATVEGRPSCDADMTEATEGIGSDSDDCGEWCDASDTSTVATDESDSSFEAEEDLDTSTHVARTHDVDLEALGLVVDAELVVIKKHPAFAYFRDATGDLEGADMDLPRFRRRPLSHRTAPPTQHGLGAIRRPLNFHSAPPTQHGLGAIL